MTRSMVVFEILPNGKSRGETHFWRFVGKQARAKRLSLPKIKVQICKLLNERLARPGIVMFAEEPVDYFPNLAENVTGRDINRLAKILCCNPKVLKSILVSSRDQINNQLKKAGIDLEWEVRLGLGGF